MRLGLAMSKPSNLDLRDVMFVSLCDRTVVLGYHYHECVASVFFGYDGLYSSNFLYAYALLPASQPGAMLREEYVTRSGRLVRLPPS